jgi:hypothetical protein
MDFNISVRSTTDPNAVIDLSATETVDKTKGVDTLTIVERASQTDPTTGAKTTVTKTVTLESPTTDLSGIDPSQLSAAVDSLKAALSPVPACQAMLGNIIQILEGVIGAYQNATPQEKQDPKNQQAASNLFQQLGSQANSLYSMLKNAYYLQNTKFVDAMIEVSQQLKTLENTVQNTSISADYDTMMLEVTQIKTEADDNYSAAMKDIDASYVEAGFQMFSAALTIAGGFVGFAKFGGTTDGIDLGTKLFGAAGSFSSGVGTIWANQYKAQSAADKQAAGYAQATEKAYEAVQKKIEQQGNIASELQQQSQSLLDATLQMYRSIIETQSQTIQQIHI